MGAMQSFVETLALRPPDRPKQDPVLPEGAERLSIPARHSMIPVYILSGDSKRSSEENSASAAAQGTTDRPWIIFSHGTTEDCTTVIKFADQLAGYTNTVVVLYEYPGYGLCKPLNKGNHEELPSEEGMYAAIKQTYAYVTKERRIAPERVIAMGWSIGSGPTMELATTHTVGGLIIQSAFQSIVRLKINTPWSFSCDPFQNGNKAREIPSGTKILILHGNADEIVPVEHGHFLYEQMQKDHDVQAVWFENRKHADLPLDKKYLRTIKTWVSSLHETASGIVSSTGEKVNTLHQRVGPPALCMTDTTYVLED